MLTKPLTIPHTPGVYFFKRGKTILYVGKAGDLQKRLSSYWRKNAGQKVSSLLQEANHVEWYECESEVDALITEAKYIKAHLPKYNVVLRDDKTYFYVAVTREEFPKLFISHNPEYQKNKLVKQTEKSNTNIQYIGPFTSGSSLREVLKMLRKIFPYCTCFTPHVRTCLNSQIGRCPGYCCLGGKNNTATETEKNAYRENIQHIVAIFEGKKKQLLGILKKEMKSAAKEQKFEYAAYIRNQVEKLENIFLHTPLLEKNKMLRVKRNWSAIQEIIQSILGTTKKISRVEGYDISNISGTEATGSMVVFINGYPAKAQYRKFKIKYVKGPNDFAMMQEVIERRLGHPEWSYPDLMIIDGGKPQLNAVSHVLNSLNKNINTVGLAKREEELYLPGQPTSIPLRTLSRETEFFFEHVRNESHRFAKKYHHKLREMSYRRK